MVPTTSLTRLRLSTCGHFRNRCRTVTDTQLTKSANRNQCLFFVKNITKTAYIHYSVVPQVLACETRLLFLVIRIPTIEERVVTFRKYIWSIKTSPFRRGSKQMKLCGYFRYFYLWFYICFHFLSFLIQLFYNNLLAIVYINILHRSCYLNTLQILIAIVSVVANFGNSIFNASCFRIIEVIKALKYKSKF